MQTNTPSMPELRSPIASLSLNKKKKQQRQNTKLFEEDRKTWTISTPEATTVFLDQSTLSHPPSLS